MGTGKGCSSFLLQRGLNWPMHQSMKSLRRSQISSMAGRVFFVSFYVIKTYKDHSIGSTSIKKGGDARNVTKSFSRLYRAIFSVI